MNGPHAIILACDDAYAYCAAVAIASIIRHTDSDIDFILLDDGISDEKKQNLLSCIHGRPGIRLRFMDMAPLAARFPDGMFSCRDYWQRSTYFRLFCPDMLPEYDMVLYLDCDVLIRADVSELFRFQMPEKTLCGAVFDNLGYRDSTHMIHQLFKLKLPYRYRYFNAGVLLMNLAEMRKVGFTEQCLQIMRRGPLKWQDQDVLNLVCRNHVFYLPVEWNRMLVEPYEPENRTLARLAGRYPVGQAKLIHYSGFCKPWFGREVQYASFWWEVAETLPFLENMELFFLKTSRKYLLMRINRLLYMFRYSYSIRLGLALTWLPRKALSILTGKEY